MMRPFQGAHSTPHSCVMAKALVYWLTEGADNGGDGPDTPHRSHTDVSDTLPSSGSFRASLLRVGLSVPMKK